MTDDQALQRLSREQGHIAVGDDDLPIEIPELGQGTLHGVAGTVLLGLQRRDRVRSDLTEVRGHLLTCMAHHHTQVIGVDGVGRADRPGQHRVPADRMQQLGRLRAHTRPASGCQHDHRCHRGGVCSHGPSLLGPHLRGAGPSIRLMRLVPRVGVEPTSLNPDSKSGGPCRQTNRGMPCIVIDGA